MSLESTAYHEAGHALFWVLEQKQLGRLQLATILPRNGLAGQVLGDPQLKSFTPRMLRAAGRLIAAGYVAARLAGFEEAAHGPNPDTEKLARFAEISGRGSLYIDECRAGAELTLRSNWTAVQRVTGYLLSAGTLTAPYAENLVRMALDERQRVLAPDAETFIRLCTAVENVPEFAEDFATAARTLSAQVA